MDRIDILVQVRSMEPEMMVSGCKGEVSDAVYRRIAACRAIQSKRSGNGTPALNARLTPGHLQELCPLEPAHRKILEGAMKHLGLTSRGYHRIIKVARTIADLEGMEFPAPEHLAEALQYRPVLEGTVTGF